MRVVLFGITREIIGANEIKVPESEQISTVADLKLWLEQRHSKLKELSSLAVAVDSEYADDTQILQASSEIALIPPVSGG